jgi:hypothetical protein
MPSRKLFPLRIGNAILCEEVRQEMFGKLSLLGVYSGDLLVAAFENYLRVAIYVELFAKEVGEKRAEVSISHLGQVVAKISIEFDFKDLRAPVNVVSSAFPIKLERPGTIVIDVSCEGIEKRALEKEVKLASPETFTVANAPAPLPLLSPTAVFDPSLPPAPSRPVRPTRRRRS